MSPIPWDDLATEDEDPPSPQVGPFLRHAAGHEGEDAPSELAESGHLVSSRPSMVAPEPMKIGRPTPFEPSAVPPESAEGGHSDSSEPSEPREGSKRQCADEEQPGLGKPAPKRPHMMALR